MLTHVKSCFDRTRVLVSGQRFESCSFKNCELVFDGRPTQLVGNYFDDCRWAFEGAAADTLAFAAAMCGQSPEFCMTFAKMVGFVEGPPN